MHPYTPERNAEEKRPAPRTDEEALGLLRERVPDPPSFWDPAVEYQLLRKAGAEVAGCCAVSWTCATTPMPRPAACSG